jgi:hypothetical protein
MRVLGAVDTALGRTRHERIHNVAAMTFLEGAATDGRVRKYALSPSFAGFFQKIIAARVQLAVLQKCR